jgi:hypothetical protein
LGRSSFVVRELQQGHNMFGWRKRNDGFEWRGYVRTTILVRRGQRRQRIDEAKGAARQGMHHAGRRGA